MRFSFLTRLDAAGVDGASRCVFLYLPLAVVAILSFNTATSLSWPPQGFTLDWWRQAWETERPARRRCGTR